MLAALGPLLAQRAPRDGARLRRHELDARRRPRRGAGRRARSRTSRRACAPTTARCPRSSTASSPTTRATCCCARPRRPRRSCAASASPARSRSSATSWSTSRSCSGRGRRRGPRRSRRPASSRAATSSPPRTAPATSTTRRGSRALVALLRAVPGPVVLPLHPRTAARLDAAGLRDALGADVRLTPPLGYLDFTALLRHARAVLTDSGGVQKEAYLAGVPCVTLRATTEWTETVDAGWNTLVDLDAAAAARGARAHAARRRARRSTATAAPASGWWRRSRVGWPRDRDQGGRRRPRLLGPESRTQLRRPSAAATSPGCATRDPDGARARRPRAPGGAARPRTSTTCSATGRSTPSCSPRPSRRMPPSPSASLEAGKHCFVEKPLAQDVASAERAVAAADAAGRVLMVGHLLEYHPAVAKLKEIAASGELGDIHYIYSNRLNLGKLRADENALWSLGAHDVSVCSTSRARSRTRSRRAASPTCGRESRTWSSASCASPPGWPRTCTCRGSTRTRSAASRSSARAGWRRSTTWTSSARSRSSTRASTRPRAPGASTSRAPATSTAPRSRTASRCGSSASTSSTCIREGRTPRLRRALRAAGGARARRDAGGARRVPPRAACGRLTSAPACCSATACGSARACASARTSWCTTGTVIGDGCEIQDGAILGKPPKLARHSSAAGRAVAALELGPGAVVCARAIVFAGARIGAGRDPRRPVLRPRARRRRRRHARRPRLGGRQRRRRSASASGSRPTST